jgi:hypothetical protein
LPTMRPSNDRHERHTTVNDRSDDVPRVTVPETA